MEPQKVSCLMVTGKHYNRRFLAQIAVDCFLKQTYQNRELIIINTSPFPWFLNCHESIKEFMYKDASLGFLRNQSLELATGDLLLQWDDDDYYSPDRIRFQVENHKQGLATILKKQYRIDLQTGEAGILDASNWPMGGIVGTILHDRSPIRYPEIPRREDSYFIRNFQPNPLDNPPEIYARLFHGGNTWDRDTILNPVLGQELTKPQKAFVEYVQCLYQIS